MIGTLGSQVQLAIESADFDAALPLIDAYGQAVRQAWEQAETSAEKLQIAAAASSFLQDRLHLARVIRSQIAARGAEAVRQLSYSDDSWQLGG